MSDEKFFYGVTCSTSNPDRAALALVLATTAKDTGHDVILWFAAEGALLARVGNAEKMKSPIFGDLGELLKKTVHLGIEIGVCGTCCKFYRIESADLAEGITKRTAAWAVEAQVGRNCLLF